MMYVALGLFAVLVLVLICLRYWRSHILPFLAKRLRRLIFWGMRLYFKLRVQVKLLMKFHVDENEKPTVKHEDLILSLTSTPTRLPVLSKTLDGLASQASEVHLNLPVHFRNDPKQTYNPEHVQQLIIAYPNLKVFWLEQDIGPALKLVPTLKRVLLTPFKERGVVMTIDDDVLLDGALPSLYMKQCLATQSVVTQFGFSKTVSGTKYTQVFGNRGVAYPLSILSPKFVETLEKFVVLAECKMHDDMAIGLALHKHNIPISIIDVQNAKSIDLEHGASEESISYLEVERMHLRDEQCIHATLVAET